MNSKELVPVRVLLPEKSQTQSLSFDEHVELRYLVEQTFFSTEISIATCNEYDEKYKTNIQGKLERYPRELLKRLTPLFSSRKDLLERAANCDFTDPIGTRNFCRSLGIINNYLCIFNFKLTSLPDMQPADPLDKEIINFVNFGENLIYKNFGRMETAIQRNIDPSDTEDAFKIVKTLLSFTTKDETKKDCFDFMLRNVEKAVQNIKVYFGKEDFLDSLSVIGLLDTFMEKGGNSQINSVKNVMIKMLKDDDIEVNIIALMELIKYWQVNPETSLVKEIAREGFNVEMHKTALPKLSSTVHGKIIFRTAPEWFFNNFCFIQNLERERPGITRTLHEEFGIIYFASYPKKMLIDQYDDFIALRKDKETKNDLPHGVIINPQNDFYGAFGDEKEIYEKLYSQIKVKSKIEIYEVGNLRELVKVFGKSRRNYGQISLAILGAHGADDALEFGYEDEGDLYSELLDTKTAEALKQAFTKNPTFILNSCEGGKLTAIGQKISKKYDATVMAPNQEIMRIKKVIANFLPNGEIGISELEYEGQGREGEEEKLVKPNVFMKGILVSNSLCA